MSANKRTRMTLLAIAFVVTLGLSWLFSGVVITDTGEKTTYNIYFDNVPTYLEEGYISNMSGTPIKFISTDMETADIIVSTNGNLVTDKNIIRKEQIAYSTVVALLPLKVTNESENMSTISTSRSYYLSANMPKIIKAFIESQNGVINLNNLGYNTKITETRLALPDTSSPYRKDTIDGLIYMITDGEDITEENKDDVREALEKLIKNAVIVNNVPDTLLDTGNNILIVPEYVLKETPRSLIKPVYWDRMCKIPVTAYLSDSVTEEHRQIILDKMNGYSSIYVDSRFRNGNKVDVNLSLKYAEKVNTREVQTNLAEMLGTKYWAY